MLTLPTLDAARHLRDFFRDAGYTEAGFDRTLGTVNPPSAQLRNMARLLDCTQDPTLFNVLARWFFVVVPVAEATARTLVPAPALDLLLDCGLLHADAGSLASQVQIVPFRDWLVVSDPDRHLESAEGFGHVLSLGPTAAHLLKFTLDRPVADTLDLGAGCGIQSLAAAAHSEAVWATDLNPRAEGYAAFNARLNGFENIHCLTGDGFAPVAGRRFDQIVTNPPFVLAPDKRFLYRDSGMALDGFCRKLVREAPGYLNDGGFFQMICEWVQIGDQPWPERLAPWFEGLGCDVWVLKDYARSPSLYALTRLRETPPADTEVDVAHYSQWLDYYREHGVSAIYGGLIFMRRRDGHNWLRFDELPPQPIDRPVGDAVWRFFAGQDFLNAHPRDEQLLQTAPALAADARLEQELRCEEGRWRPARMQLTRERGLPYRIGMAEDMARFLAGFDGRHSLGQLVEALAAEVGGDRGQVQGEVLRVTRRLIELGFLEV